MTRSLAVVCPIHVFYFVLNFPLVPGFSNRLINHRRNIRLDNEHAACLPYMLRTMQPLYSAYLKAVPPKLWSSLPSIDEICDLPELVWVAKAQPGGPGAISAKTFNSVIALLPSIIDAWKQRYQEKLHDMVESEYGGLCIWDRSNCVNRATAVFSCITKECVRSIKGPFITWEEAIRHKCAAKGSRTIAGVTTRQPLPSLLGFSKTGAKAAKELVELANLDPLLATPEDMDALGLLFLCTECSAAVVQLHNTSSRTTRMKGYPAYTWRQAVSTAQIYTSMTVLSLPLIDRAFYEVQR